MAFTQCPSRKAWKTMTMPKSKGGLCSAPTSMVQFRGATIRPSLVKASWSQNVGKVTLIKSGPRKASNQVMTPMLQALASKYAR